MFVDFEVRGNFEKRREMFGQKLPENFWTGTFDIRFLIAIRKRFLTFKILGYTIMAVELLKVSCTSYLHIIGRFVILSFSGLQTSNKVSRGIVKLY